MITKLLLLDFVDFPSSQICFCFSIFVDAVIKKSTVMDICLAPDIVYKPIQNNEK